MLVNLDEELSGAVRLGDFKLLYNVTNQGVDQSIPVPTTAANPTYGRDDTLGVYLCVLGAGGCSNKFS